MLVCTDGLSRLIVGGTILSRIASTEKMASTAPAAPSKWPMEDILHRRLQVVDVPVGDCTAGRSMTIFVMVWFIPAVDDAQLVLVVAYSELDVRRILLIRPLEVRVNAEQVGVPVTGGDEVVGEEVDGGESSQHL